MQNTYFVGEAETMLFKYKIHIIHQKIENSFVLAFLADSALLKRLNIVLLIFQCNWIHSMNL